MGKRLRLSLVVGLVIWGSLSKGETAEAQGWISQLGQVGFQPSGAAMLPPAVISSMREGDISPIMQFVLASHMMNSCVKDVTKPGAYPKRRDPYVVAKAKFDYGICRIKKCFQQAMLMLILPQMSSNERNGGSSDPGTQDSSQNLGMVMAQAFQKDKGCTGGSGSGSSSGISSGITGAMK